jgi:hypothetical protein
MANPVTVDIPHRLGRNGARSRLDGSIGKLADMFPGGGTVTHHWEGDTMVFTVQAMGQSIASRLEVRDAHVHAVIDLPPFLSLFAERIRAKLGKDGPKLLE